MRKYGVIFDVDGVIVDSAPPHRESWRRLADEVHLPMSDEFFARIFGQTNKDILEALFGRALPDEEWRRLGDRKEAFYRDIIRHSVPAMPGAVGLIEALHADGARLAIGSSGPPENIELCLREMGILERFDAVVTGNDVTRGKPDPQVFLLAAERIGLSPERCVVVEDAVTGVEAAKRAGMRAVALTSSHPLKSFPHADLLVEGLTALSPARLSSLVGAR
ncbi:MAG: HAD family phosphatase [Verrucomicrobia bacterium]|nr:HAD family phosphatase [Verrucomicrobiota bacterium]